MNKESIKIIKRVVLAVVILVLLVVVINIKPAINAMASLDTGQEARSFGLTDILFVFVMIMISSIFLMFLFNKQGLIVKSQPPEQKQIKGKLKVREFAPEELMSKPVEEPKPYKIFLKQIQPLKEMIKREDTKVIRELKEIKQPKRDTPREEPKEDYISLLPTPKGKYVLRTVKLTSREEFLQTLNHVRESNSVLFLDINNLARHDSDMLKRYLSKLKTTSDITNSQIAFLSKTHLIVVPPFVDLYRKK